MRADGVLKIIIIRYLKEAKEAASRRVEDIIKLLDAEFARPTQEVIIPKINSFMNPMRRPGEDIRLFWIRSDKARIAVELSDTILPETVLHRRALNALKMTGTNKAVLLSGLESFQGVPTVKVLKGVPVKIFGSTIDESTELILEAADSPSRVDTEDQDEEMWAVKGKPKSPNRPSSNVASVRGAIRSMNLDNGYQPNASSKGSKKFGSKGKAWCVRCGSVDHQWQQRPLPYQPQLDFGKSNGSPSQWKGGKRIPLTEEIATTSTDDKVENVDADASTNPAVYELEEDESQFDPYAYGTWYTAGEHQDWYLDENVWMCIEWIAADSKVPQSIYQGAAILDSGASTTVTGTTWMQAWNSSYQKDLRPSSRTFRF